MKMKKITLLLLSIVATSLLACNGGSTSSGGGATTSNPLQNYVNKLDYNSKVLNKSLQSGNSNQQSFSLNRSAVLSNVQISYFESANCSSGLNSTVTLNGPAQMIAGTYTSTNASNSALCQLYPTGCTGLLSTVQNSTAWSMQYTYTYTNGSSYQSVCMNNPNNPVGKSAEFVANYTSGVAACTTGNSCGFSQVYSVLPLGWTNQVGATGGQVFSGGITSDLNGNKYVTGSTNVGISGQSLTGTGGYFIAKYSESGLLLWTKLVNINDGNGGTGIGSDSNNNIYVTGGTKVGLSGQTQNGVRDYYIAKYDENGNLLWTRQVGTAGGSTTGYNLTTDAIGNSYVTGITKVGISGQTLTGIQDYFVAKYDTNGNLLWTRQVGATGGSGTFAGTVWAFGIGVDSIGNSYITGATYVGISGQSLIGIKDYFVAKYSESGLLLWTKEIGATGGTSASNGITTDAMGNSYITGSTNVGISGQSLTGIQDYFIAKYDTTGNLLWTKEVGSTGGKTNGVDISSDINGNSYITGNTDVGISGQSLTGVKDYFVAKYSESGLLLWTKEIGGYGGGVGVSGSDIISDLNGNSYVTGYASYGLSGQAQSGAVDYFISKIPNQ